MKDVLSKFTSRKFLSCAAGIVIGVCLILGADGETVNAAVEAVDKVSGAVLALGSIITYICTEGKIDAEAVDKIKDVIDKVEDAADAVEKIEE